MKCKKTTLKNGLRILTIPMKDNPTSTVLVLVSTGSKYETKNINGLSHFLEHMCFKGTTKRPSALHITHELDGLGSESNAFTSQEVTGYYAKSASKNTDKLIDIVSDVYLNSTFPEAEMEKEKGVIIEEINMYEDLPQRKVQEVFAELLYGDTPAGWSIAGPKENIKKMCRDDFVKYKKDHYVAESTVIVVSGGIDEKKAIQSIKKAFEGIPATKKKSKLKVVEKQNSPQIKIVKKKTDQTHLVLGFRSVPIDHKLTPALSVLSGVLGSGMSSRLFQKLREDLGVAYYVASSNDLYTDHGVFQIVAGITTNRLEEVVKAILEECKKLKEELVSKEELLKTKEFLIGRMKLALEGSDEIAEFYGGQEVLKAKYKTPEERAKEIRKITDKDILNVAKTIFKNEVLNIAVIGPNDSTEKLRKILKI